MACWSTGYWLGNHHSTIQYFTPGRGDDEIQLFNLCVLVA